MADKKVSELDAIAGSATAADDLFLIVDSSGSVTKKITRAELNNAIEQDVLSTVDINGGTIDSTVIGGTTPAAGDFTTLGATGNITVGGTVDGRDVATDGTKLDGIEASATADQTDAEIRAAVEAASDSNVFTDADHTKLNGIEAAADVTDATNVAAAGALMTSGGTVTGDVTFTGDNYNVVWDKSDNSLEFKDNARARFGDGNDLQIYHTGSISQILDIGSGDLWIGGDANINIANAALNEYKAQFATDGAVTLYHNNSPKIATTSTGVSVTGQVIATKGSTGSLATFTDGVATNFTMKTDGSNVGTFGTEAGSTQLAFMVANTEAARFDGSRNLLVGKTADNVATVGIEARATGPLISTRDGADALRLNRLNSDGEIIQLRKDGTTVGVIGTQNWGIGTSSPVVPLQVKASSPAVSLQASASKTSGSRADFNAYNSDVSTVGYIRFGAVTDNVGTDIQFANRPAGGSLTERMRLDSSGNLLIGKTASNFSTDGIEIAPGGQILATATNAECFFFDRSNDGKIGKFFRNGAEKGSIQVSSSGTAYNTTSDIRLKQDIEPLAATDKLMQMNPVSYAWKADPDGPRSMGFIAQEMQEVMPEAVSTGDDDDAMMSMDYGRITPILVSALQDAHRKIEKLAAEIAELKAN